MTGQLVAILEDDPRIRGLLSQALEEAGFRTICFGRAGEFEAACRRAQPDVCLVDLGLPDRDGLVVVHRLALESGAAIIIISGRAHVRDRVTGLDLGADDYIIKPFDPVEVVARVRAQLRRRVETEASAPKSARFSGWSVHFDSYRLVGPDGEEQSITHAEGELLRVLLASPRRLVSRAQMQEQLGGTAGDSFDRAIDVRISRLRTKLGENPKNPRLIKTIYGAGYVLVSDVSWCSSRT